MYHFYFNKMDVIVFVLVLGLSPTIICIINTTLFNGFTENLHFYFNRWRILGIQTSTCPASPKAQYFFSILEVSRTTCFSSVKWSSAVRSVANPTLFATFTWHARMFAVRPSRINKNSMLFDTLPQKSHKTHYFLRVWRYHRVCSWPPWCSDTWYPPGIIHFTSINWWFGRELPFCLN